MKQWAQNAVLIATLQLAYLPLSAHAFGEPGRWSSGWGQGTSEYTVVDAQQNSLYIACGDSPVTMTLTLGKKEYGSYSKKGFDLIIDGRAFSTPYDTSYHAGADNFRYLWDLMRKAKTLQAKTEDGKTVKLPLAEVANALPSAKSKNFPCNTEF